MKNIFVMLAFAGSLLAYSCQDSSNSAENTEASATDSTTSGLEGTRDQAGTVTGSEVLQDTSAGQSAGKEKAGAQSANADSVNADTGKSKKD